ncbi:class gamma glutathione S-transferase [Circinella umbellata]|nr:class gamma glutathione S-transferase [Circinella umbellata]
MALNNLKIVYFNLGTLGRAESIRLLLEDAGIEYQYESIERSTWPSFKEKLISEGHPAGCVPYIVLDEKMYFGSTPIIRFLCKKLGQYKGSNDDEEQFIDACADFADDFWNSYFKILWNPTDEALKEEYEKNDGIKHLSRMERYYGVNEGPYVLGTEISYVDFMVYHTLDDQKRTQNLKNYPNLAKFIETFSARPNIAKYLTIAPPKIE